MEIISYPVCHRSLIHWKIMKSSAFKQMAKNGKISEKALSTVEEYIPGLLKENGQLSVTEDHQSESTGSESESDLEQ